MRKDRHRVHHVEVVVAVGKGRRKPTGVDSYLRKGSMNELHALRMHVAGEVCGSWIVAHEAQKLPADAATKIERMQGPAEVDTMLFGKNGDW